jgi:hypothetical protein
MSNKKKEDQAEVDLEKRIKKYLSMSDLVSMTKVYIIESPSFNDILENRKEGGALSKVLDLSKIRNELYNVSDIDTLRLALTQIAEEVNEIKSELGAVHLHFSMHGSDLGIELSDKTFLDWESFYNIIKEFNDNIGYIELPNGQKISPTYLTFSVCDGFYANTIKDFGKESPFTTLIGPVQPVTWSDSLLAYSIFFHNTIIKKLGTMTALENMNKIVGVEGVFQAEPAKGMKIY